ncbi:class IV adenylate cyclase [Streptomyces sp. TLI_171]|uniref:class IV adenylate cyclase n=1 Tax=Streptomyces sp. TLI_171 TaxID=1938859 RepID=UPI000C1A7386|nr:class IV adenylate cyclase [Streptomyces sp. TLI_171]RKE18927.1 adenylate cyclase class 2 [Streptomyces sp. TLI_171]
MPIEAELKARVRDVRAVVAELEAWSGREGRVEVYRDVYFDRPDGELAARGAELRVRTVSGGAGERTVLTYKGRAVDAGSGSKPETETAVADPVAVRAVLRGSGLVETVAFEKHCRNWELTVEGRRLLATVAEVPELAGVFLEVETPAADEAELPAALGAVRAALHRLGVAERDLSTELYTDAVARARQES